MSGSGRMIVLAPPELEPGFRLAGVEVRAVGDVAQTEAVIDSILAEGTTGVVAVYEPYLTGLEDAKRHRLERSLMPVIVPLPAGAGTGDAATRRDRLLARLQRAIGFRVTFGEGSDG